MERGAAESQRLQEEIATAKRLLRPSDDPVGTRHSLLTRARLSQIDQFLGNIDFGRADLDATDSLLGQVADRIRRAQELATALSSDNRTAGREQAALEVDGLIDELIALGNGSMRGRHFFGGESTIETPFVRDGDSITYNGSDNAVLRRVSSDDPLVETTTPGSSVFFQDRDAGTNVVQDGIFTVLVELRDALQNSDGPAAAVTLDGLSQALDGVLGARAVVGARSDRIEQVEQRLESSRLELQDLQSQVEDSDLTEAITALQIRQTALQATLGVSAQLLPVSLMDFLF